jgi:hypothetical protein
VSQAAPTPEQNQEARDIHQLRGEIAFGLDVQKFMQSQLGVYLVARARAERAEALEALADVDAEDGKAIRALQASAAVAAAFEGWLQEAVAAGINAEANYIAQEDLRE